MTFRYFINEFSVRSDFPLALDASARSPRTDLQEIVLRRASLADVPCVLRKIRRQLAYDVGEGFLLDLLSNNGPLTILIDYRARTVTVDCTDECLPIAAAWFTHAGLGAATVTHGGLPMHGAGLEVGGRYIALMAGSGVGKSTLSWYLLEHGARFANDDLVPLRWSNDVPIAYPAVSLYPNLSREMADRRRLDTAGLLHADHGREVQDYYVPISLEKRVTSPAPLSAVFVLRPHKANHGKLLQLGRMRDLVAARQMSPEAVLKTLGSNMHAVWLLGKWMNTQRLMILFHRLAESVPFYELSYPRTFAALPTLGESVYAILRDTPGD